MTGKQISQKRQEAERIGRKQIFQKSHEVEELNVAICDDEEYVRSYIRRLIEKQGMDCKIREFSSGEELLKAGKEETADILFLDISMENMDGMAVAKQLRNQARERGEAIWGGLPLLIFVTGYPEYVKEAFLVNAFQFLTKPIKEKEFEAVFKQAVRECRCLAARKQEMPKELLIRTGNTTRMVPSEKIYYVESSNRKVILCLSHEKIIYYGRISQLEEELSETFFRIHRGYLVNMKYVERYSRTEVWMKNGDSLLISKYKYQDFVKAYLNYISEEKH